MLHGRRIAITLLFPGNLSALLRALGAMRCDASAAHFPDDVMLLRCRRVPRVPRRRTQKETSHKELKLGPKYAYACLSLFAIAYAEA